MLTLHNQEDIMTAVKESLKKGYSPGDIRRMFSEALSTATTELEEQQIQMLNRLIGSLNDAAEGVSSGDFPGNRIVMMVMFRDAEEIKSEIRILPLRLSKERLTTAIERATHALSPARIRPQQTTSASTSTRDQSQS